jgi:hypothetical protein
MKSSFSRYALIFALVAFSGCRGLESRDALLSTAENPSHTRRATVIQRQYVIDGRVENSPTTYVLVSEDRGRPDYPSGVEFPSAEVAMSPLHCGPLTLSWKGDDDLVILCDRCGLSLSAAGQHVDQIGRTRIEYEGFPESSSWETAPPAGPGRGAQ